MISRVTNLVLCRSVLMTFSVFVGCLQSPSLRDQNKSNVFYIENGRIHMRANFGSKGRPSLKAWEYDGHGTGTPLWWLAPITTPKMAARQWIQFEYGTIPNGYEQRYPLETRAPIMPTNGAIVIFSLTVRYDTLFAASGEGTEYAYVYEKPGQWTPTRIPDNAYTPKGWGLAKPWD